jgi:hypothetical protein
MTYLKSCGSDMRGSTSIPKKERAGKTLEEDTLPMFSWPKREKAARGMRVLVTWTK